MKVVINTRFGGFGLSKEGIRAYEIRRWDVEAKNVSYPDPLPKKISLLDAWEIEDLDRTDPILVHIIEQNSNLYSGSSGSLKVVTIPDDVQWHIHDYDGQESIHENHRTWY
jgi:hypothetical protein